MNSPAEHLVEFLSGFPDGASLLAEVFSLLPPLEGAVLAHAWEDFWMRPEQRPPDGPWRSWGGLTGRGWGKTRTFAEFVHGEAASGRAMRIALIAQNEDKCLEVLVNGHSGLLAVSPPWFKARFECGRVVWPNGAQAFIYTPEVPRAIFGPEHHLAWASEIHAWPRVTMEEAFANLRMGLRLGYGRMVWDSNPKPKHPIIKLLLARSESNPKRHVVVRGTSYENKYNLTAGAIEEWEGEWGGTQRGRMMIYGEQPDDEDGALIRQEWIDRSRRDMPPTFKRRLISVDPALSIRGGTDATGIVELALGLDDQVLVIDDASGHLEWSAWGRLVVRRYFAARCDCCIIERNAGGDACVANLRTACAEMGFTLVVLKLEAPCPGHVPGVMHAKEVISRSAKEARLEAVAPLYERGRVSHIRGGNLSELEEQATTWEPGPKSVSPNALDAMVHGVWELAGLWSQRTDYAKAYEGVAKIAAQLSRPAAGNIAALLGGGGGRSL